MSPKSRIPQLLLVALLLAFGVAPACATKGHHETHAAVAALEGEWILVGFAPGDALPSGAAAPTLAVTSDGKLSGFAGVNSYSGQLDLSELRVGRFQTGPLAATLMAGSPEAMEVERQFLQALGEADGYRASASDLALTHAGRDVARFRRK